MSIAAKTRDAKSKYVYVNTGTINSRTWVLANEIAKCSVKRTDEEIDTSSRGDNGIKTATKGINAEITIEIENVYNVDDTLYATLSALISTTNSVEVAVCHVPMGDVTSTAGHDGDIYLCQLHDGTEFQESDASRISGTFKPTKSGGAYPQKVSDL